MATGFPPAKGNANSKSSMVNPIVETLGPTSTGAGGLKITIKMKNAAIKGAPGAGPDKDVNLN